MYFGHIPAWQTEHGRVEVDWKNLTLTSLPVGTKDESIGYGFNYRIRGGFISARSLPPAEPRAKEKGLTRLTPSYRHLFHFDPSVAVKNSSFLSKEAIQRMKPFRGKPVSVSDQRQSIEAAEMHNLFEMEDYRRSSLRRLQEMGVGDSVVPGGGVSRYR
jgi:hypothetical protein